jgi:hypothetical protein
MELRDQRLRQALLTLDLVMITAQHRLQGGGRLHQGLCIDIRRQARFLGYRVHWLLLPPFRSPSLAAACRAAVVAPDQ